MPHRHKHKTAMMTAEVVPGPSTTALLDRKLKETCEKEHVPEKRSHPSTDPGEVDDAKKVKLSLDAKNIEGAEVSASVSISKDIKCEKVSGEAEESPTIAEKSNPPTEVVKDVDTGKAEKEAVTSVVEVKVEVASKTLAQEPEKKKEENHSQETIPDDSPNIKLAAVSSAPSSSLSPATANPLPQTGVTTQADTSLKAMKKEMQETEKKEYTEMKPALMAMDKAPVSEPEELESSCMAVTAQKPSKDTSTPASMPARPVGKSDRRRPLRKADIELQPLTSVKKAPSGTKRDARPVREKAKVATPELSQGKQMIKQEEAVAQKAKVALSKEKGTTTDDSLLDDEEIQLQMEETYDIRRSFITLEMPTVGTLKMMYPNLFKGKQMLQEFQRITNIDIDITIQEYCVKYASKIIDCARHLAGAMNIIRQAEAVKMQNVALRQYWDMVTALCLISLLLKENLVEMVREIEEDEEVDPKGKIVPILISKGPLFKSDEFALVVEEEIVQECEEFTIAFAMLFASYWVFNMQYPKTLHHTYNFIQKAILHLKDGTPIPPPCKQLMQRLNKADVMQASTSKIKPKNRP